MRTLPLGSSVAVWSQRVEAMAFVEAHPEEQAGTPPTEKLWVAESWNALVTVAVMPGAMPPEAQEGAVQVTRLVEAPFTGGARAPVVALHVNVRALDWGSRAVTSKVTVCPGEVAVADW